MGTTGISEDGRNQLNFRHPGNIYAGEAFFVTQPKTEKNTYETCGNFQHHPLARLRRDEFCSGKQIEGSEGRKIIQAPGSP
jgi:hypothetical protein